MIFEDFTPATWVIVGVALIVGVVLKCVFGSSSKNNNGEDVKKLHDELNLANKTIASLTSSIKSKNNSSKETEKLKDELREANDKIRNLEKCILSGDENEAKLLLQEEKTAIEKKVVKLKDELEDKEDEIDELQKKVESKELERVRLEDELYGLQKNLKEVKENNQELEAKNNAAKKEIEEFRESNSFVSTLLSAPSINAEDTKKIEQIINSIERFVEVELKPFYYSHFKMDQHKVEMLGSKEDESIKLKTWVAQSKKTWLSNKKVISFIGEFSAGKTTIVNRILKQDNKNAAELPTSSKATTAIPTYISGGKLTKYTFVSPDDCRKEIAKDKFESVKKETLAKFEGINRLIKYFVMEYDNKNLQHLSILDTPGFQSNDPEDERRTMDVVNESDVLFWVVDVNKGELNKKSVGILKGLKKPLYIILNQCDSKSLPEVEKAKEKIKVTAKNEGLHVIDVIPFGKDRYQLSAIMDVIARIQMTNTNHYIDDLYSMVKGDEHVHKALLSKKNKDLEERDEILESCTEKFNEDVRILKRNAENAKSRPHYEEHWFRKDNYEMSQLEYKQLVTELNDCVEYSKAIKNDFDDQMENVRERTNVQNEKFEIEDINNEFLKLSANLAKLVKEMKNVKG